MYIMRFFCSADGFVHFGIYQTDAGHSVATAFMN